MSISRAGALIWTTRVLIILALPGPLLEILTWLTKGSIRIPQPKPGSTPEAILVVAMGVFALYWFLLWVSGKIVCAVLAILTIMVALLRGINSRTRALTVAAGSITCCLLLWWINVAKHQW